MDGRTEAIAIYPSLFLKKSVKINITYLYLSGLDNIVMSPAKHGRHIGIKKQLASSSSAASHFWFLINNCEGIHPFYSKFTEGKAS